MKYLLKLKVILLAFFTIFTINVHAADKILPLAKPIPDHETKTKTAKKKEIYPEKRPAERKEIDVVEKIEDDAAIYPKAKPLVFKKKEVEKAVAKSTILSKKDFQIAKSVFNLIEKKKWQTALKQSKKSRDKT